MKWGRQEEGEAGWQGERDGWRGDRDGWRGDRDGCMRNVSQLNTLLDD